ncbi:MAG: HAD family phosphatase [Phycisphaeraceae bacterium]|nr:MAG: HAD family phosphatase [Phycisphaeraceae bacterium]
MLNDCDLVIFDCDGVLVDTEPLTSRLMAKCVTELGWAIDQDYAVEHFKGRPLDEICGRVGEHLGRACPELAEIYRERMYAEMEAGGIGPIDGAAELLDALAALPSPPKVCVASNGPRRKMAISMHSAGLAERFGGLDSPLIFSAYDIGKSKPDPALFLHAAAALGVEPSRCVTLDDSESGMEAAVAAGMYAIGVAGLTPPEKLAAHGADMVVQSLRELLPLGAARA